MSEQPIPPNIAQLTGPVLLGHLFNWGLFGALILQSYIYYLSFPNDRILPKILVSVVLVIEILQTVLATRDAFRNFGTGWGDMIGLNAVGWLWFSVPVMSALISSMAQTFFAWRILVLSHKAWIPAAVVLLSIVQAVAGIWCGIFAHILGEFSEVQRHLYRQTSVWLGGTALCDVIIAVSMLYYLSKSRTGFRSTNLFLAKLIRITVETGMVCAAFAILDLSFFLRFQDNNYHLAPSIALSKLYSNSLLAVLNTRVRIIGGRSSPTMASDDITLSVSAGDTLLQRMAKQARDTAPAINVSVNCEVKDDIPMQDVTANKSIHSSAGTV